MNVSYYSRLHSNFLAELLLIKSSPAQKVKCQFHRETVFLFEKNFYLIENITA